jgi:hypothetical protein
VEPLRQRQLASIPASRLSPSFQWIPLPIKRFLLKHYGKFFFASIFWQNSRYEKRSLQVGWAKSLRAVARISPCSRQFFATLCHPDSTY